MDDSPLRTRTGAAAEPDGRDSVRRRGGRRRRRRRRHGAGQRAARAAPLQRQLWLPW